MRLSDTMLRLYIAYREVKGFPPMPKEAIKEHLEHESDTVEAFCDFLLEKVLPGIR